mmetsp:Transcript_908/g.1460  ORF Transcript_908/g.1460 Transcript_908/m.1460 type:complete len:81 (+) Transcript_908:83-325(+)
MMPLSRRPNIKANPFCTEPACFVTKPTTIPPREFVMIGIKVFGVHWWKKPFWEMLLPSVLNSNDTIRMMADAAFISILNR